MRSVRGLLLATLVSCSAERTPLEPSPPPESASNLAVVKVEMRVTGDPGLLYIGGLGTYNVTVDDERNFRLTSGAAPISIHVPAGLHTIRFQRSVPQSALAGILIGTSLPPSWCNILQPFVIEGSFTPGSTSEMTFVVDCPPLEGTGTLRVKLSASGEHAHDQLRMDLISKADGGSSRSFVIDANRDTVLSVRTGIYLLGLDAPGCQFANGPYSGLPAPLFLRRDSVVNVALTLPCK